MNNHDANNNDGRLCRWRVLTEQRERRLARCWPHLRRGTLRSTHTPAPPLDHGGGHSAVVAAGPAGRSPCLLLLFFWVEPTHLTATCLPLPGLSTPPYSPPTHFIAWLGLHRVGRPQMGVYKTSVAIATRGPWTFVDVVDTSDAHAWRAFSRCCTSAFTCLLFGYQRRVHSFTAASGVLFSMATLRAPACHFTLFSAAPIIWSDGIEQYVSNVMNDQALPRGMVKTCLPSLYPPFMAVPARMRTHFGSSQYIPAADATLPFPFSAARTLYLRAARCNTVAAVTFTHASPPFRLRACLPPTPLVPPPVGCYVLQNENSANSTHAHQLPVAP